MQIYFNTRIDHYKKIFPNISFPASGPSDVFLAQQGAYKVASFRDYDRATQKLVSCDPVIENGFAYVVAVVDKTEEEIAADVAAKAAQVRATRDAALTASDWTQVADAPVDKVAWATYRQALRDLPDAEGFPNVDLPLSPDQQGE
jgi:hypothetical protein